MTTTDALLRAVIVAPGDDLPRLVYADHLDENGTTEAERCRAEFIRVQCEIANRGPVPCERCGSANSGNAVYTHHCRGRGCRLRRREYESSKRFIVWDWLDGVGANAPYFQSSDWVRGFPGRLTCRMDQFVNGGPCPVCQNPRLTDVLNDIGRQIGEAIPCPRCKGTHTVPGIAREVFSRWPVREVRLTDQMAYPRDGDVRFGWFHPVVPSGNQTRIQSLNVEIFERIKGHYNDVTDSRVKWFRSRHEADAALSDAAVACGRGLVGLGPLTHTATGRGA